MEDRHPGREEGLQARGRGGSEADFRNEIKDLAAPPDGFDGGMDLNIAIRTAVIAHGEAIVHAGGAVTLASDPDGEYQETLVKAERVLAAFRPDGEI